MHQELYKELRDKSVGWKGEEEVRHGWTAALEKALRIEFKLERYREDSSYNNVIIEFKDKGFFRSSDTSPKFLEARDRRLKPYIQKAAKRDGLPESHFIGIGVDGDHIFFAQVIDGIIINGPLLPLSEVSIGMVCDALESGYRRSVTSTNLIEDFGLRSEVGTTVMQLLASEVEHYVSSHRGSKIKMLFAEWRTLYGQVADMGPSEVDRIQAAIGIRVDASPELQVPIILFCIHTYNTLLIKLLGAEIVGSHGLTSYEFFSQNAIAQSDDSLIATMDGDIERGRYFASSNIKGFIEEAIFSWYIDACKDRAFKTKFVPALRHLLGKLAIYRTDDLEASRSKDVLKAFYQNLVPEILRKSLGEFYTPDWLVDVAVDKVEPQNWLGLRCLDPTCGSGSFLLEVIRRKRRAGERSSASAVELLEDITQNVWGFDLNPLAVQTARVNFLIAIADLLKAAHGHQVELPVLLADAVYSPAPDPENDVRVVKYQIGSQIANLELILPSPLALDRVRLDIVFEIMGEHVDKGKAYDIVERDLMAEGSITPKELEDWREVLALTYTKVLELHRREWNGIWFRIVRNFFWSATAERFDLVVGNPPWVRWSKLPELYRERAKPTCESYEIFSSTPFNGGNELDISAMITYTVSDKWLKGGGQMAFVIPQNHFQVPSSEGFRRFRINNEFNLVPLKVYDLKGLQPFPGVTNRTAIAIFQKSDKKAAAYPVPYTIWEARAGSTRRIPESLTKEQVLARIQTEDMEAHPVGEEGSPWAILRLGRFDLLERLRGECEWVQGRKGVTSDLNPIYHLNIESVNERTGQVQIVTRPEAGKKDVGPRRSFWVEPDLLYPLMKGASDFGACRITRSHNLYTLIPNKGIRRSDYEAAEGVMRGLRRTAAYFDAYEDVLRTRSTFAKRQEILGAPYYAVYNVGAYTFAPYKVFWAEQGRFRAAVVGLGEVPLLGPRPFVPDHKLFFADFSEAEPAYFLCGLLNSDAVQEYIESHTIQIQVGDVFKHMTLPFFNPGNPLHLQLSQRARYAHECLEEEYPEILSEVRSLAEGILFPR